MSFTSELEAFEAGLVKAMRSEQALTRAALRRKPETPLKG